MKKLLILLLTLCLVIVSAFSLVACGHEHSFTNGVCECGEQDPNYQPSSGLTKADYVEVYSKVLAEVDAYVSGATLLRTTIPSTDFVEVPVNQGINAVKGNTAMLYFLRNLCNNANFEIVDGFQEILVIDDVSGPYAQTFKIRIAMDYDSVRGAIKSVVYVEDHTSSNVGVYSLEFEFLYNFDTETLSGFSVLGIMGEKQNLSANDVNFLKYENSKVYMINPSASVFNQFASEVLAEYQTISTTAFGSSLPNYSAEYINAMLEAFA